MVIKNRILFGLALALSLVVGKEASAQNDSTAPAAPRNLCIGTDCTPTSVCSEYDECDEFERGSIGGDWVTEGNGWSVSAGSLRNVYASGGNVSLIRRAGSFSGADQCQTIQIANSSAIQAGTGFVFRATGSNLASSSRLDVVFAQDQNPQKIMVFSYTNGASPTLEGELDNFSVSYPFFLSACVEGTGSSTLVRIFNHGNSAPSGVLSSWASAFVDSVAYDGSPNLNSGRNYGLRNWRNSSAAGELRIGWWGAKAGRFEPPTFISLSQSSISRSHGEGENAPNASLEIGNIGGGSLNWTSELVNGLEDCNGGASGGRNWLDWSPKSGSGVTSSSPDTVSLTFNNSSNCRAANSPATATIRFSWNDGISGNQTADVTVQLNTSLPSSVPIPGGSVGQSGATGWEHTGVSLQSCENFASGSNYVLDGRSSPLVVDGCDFSGRTVRIYGEVTLRRSRVVNDDDFDCQTPAIGVQNGAGPVLIEDVEIRTTNPNARGGEARQDRTICVFKNNNLPLTIRRVWTHGSIRGLDFTSEQNILVEDSYLGPNASPPIGQPVGSCANNRERRHASAIRAAGGTNNITLNNTVLHIGYCSWASGLIATYPENGANGNWTINGGRWIIEDQNGGGYGIAAGYSPGEQQNYNYTVQDLEISTQYYSNGCPSGCAQQWNELGGNSTWTNVRKYNPGQPDHGQIINP